MDKDINELILGDNLLILKNIKSESVDLIYLDPPFFSNKNYEVIWGDKGEIASFEDRWSGGIMHYIEWLKERVQEMHRILKPTGSIFLHCDWHANAEIKIFILNKLFGEKNYQNAIAWKRTTAHNDSKRYGNIYDVIYWYSKTDNKKFNPIKTGYSPEQLARYKYEDITGRFRAENLTAPHFSPTRTIEWRGVHPGENRQWRFSIEKLEQLYAEGRILLQRNGKPRKDGLKEYLAQAGGTPLQDMWLDISLAPTAAERIGYPTQKPEALLKRIIQSVTDEGDLVLDPFMGGGTSIAVADQLNRRWIGIDQSVQAVKITEMRLNKQQDLFSRHFISRLHKYDYNTLRYKNAFEFESWIVQQYGGLSNFKQRGDMGIDGTLRDGTPIQVKRSDAIGRNVVDNFLSAIQRYDKAAYERNKAVGDPVGILIAFSFGKGLFDEVARLKLVDEIIIKLVAVGEIVEIANGPTLQLEVNGLVKDAKGCWEVQFDAKAESKDHIEFYSWDWNFAEDTKIFRPEIFKDTTGTQLKKLDPGFHSIAVKVHDGEGLEATEVIKLKVNGQVVKNPHLQAS